MISSRVQAIGGSFHGHFNNKTLVLVDVGVVINVFRRKSRLPSETNIDSKRV